MQNLNTVCCDTLEFDVDLINEDGTKLILGDEDKLWFAVKKNYTDEEPKIYIEQNSTHFKIPAQNPELPAGIYMYEIGILFADGTVKTVLHNEKLYVENKLRGHVYGE